MNDDDAAPESEVDLSEKSLERSSLELDEVASEYRLFRHAVSWLGWATIASVTGVVVMGICGHAMIATSLVAVATAAVAGMASLLK